MSPNNFLVFLVLVCVAVSNNASASIPCPLVWVDYHFGDALPPSVVRFNSLDVVARVRLPIVTATISKSRESSTRTVPGKIAEAVGAKYETFSVEGDASDSWEVLTNPHHCTLKWLREGAGGFGVKAQEYSAQHVVARAVVREGAGVQVLPAWVNATSRAVTPSGKGHSALITSHELLHAFQPGLILQMFNFKFTAVAYSGSREFLGSDEIYNKAGTLVKQTVLHRKKVHQITEFTSSSSSRSTWKVLVNATVDFQFGGLNFTGRELNVNYTHESSSEDKSYFYQETEVDVVVQREVVVEPFNSVTICSTVDLAENLELAYTCRGRYTADGLTATEIAAILAQDGIYGTPSGDSVLVDMSGTMQGVLVLQTKFVVVNYDDPEGCLVVAT